MTTQPKLKIKMYNGNEEIRDLKEVKDLYSTWMMMVLVDGYVVNSYEEMVNLVTQEQYKDKEFVEVALVPFIEGG